MGTISQSQACEIRQALHEVALDLLKAQSPPLTKDQLLSTIQAIEDWWDANRATLKSAMEAAAGATLSNALAKTIAKYWLRMKWELE